MPSVKEIKEQRGESLKKMQQQRDQYHKLIEEKKPAEEIRAAKDAFDEERKNFESLGQQLADENAGADMDSFLEEVGKQARDDGRTKPGQDDFDGRSRGGDGTSDGPLVDDHAYALQAWARRSMGLPLSKRHKAAQRRCKIYSRGRSAIYRSLSTRDFRRLQAIYRSASPKAIEAFGAELERRFLSPTTATAGAETVPQGFINQIESAQLAYSGVLQAADVMRTQTGNDLPWPTDNDTSNEGEIIGEGAPFDDDIEVPFDSTTFKAYKSHSKMIKVAYELIEDWGLAVDLEQFLADKSGERLGRHRNRLYTTGTGVNQPTGIVTAATLGITAAAPAAITGDEVLRLIHSVDPSYRQGGTVGFMMHDNIWLEALLLKDGNGQYIHTPGLADDVRPRIRGHAVFINQHMDSALAAANDAILFGRLSNYKVREVAQIRFKRLAERYADEDVVAFDALQRHDGQLLDAGTHPVKRLRMAA